MMGISSVLGMPPSTDIKNTVNESIVDMANVTWGWMIFQKSSFAFLKSADHDFIIEYVGFLTFSPVSAGMTNVSLRERF